MVDEFKVINNALLNLDIEDLEKKYKACQYRGREIEVGIIKMKEEFRENNRKVQYYASLINVARNYITLSKISPPPKPKQSDKFKDRTIIEACFAILSGSKEPMHISYIVQYLKAGGMVFRAEDPTDSIEVTIKRETVKFERVAPRTYKLKG